MLAGVAGAVARRVGADPTVVRIGLVLLSVFGGIGLAVYVLAWLAIPMDGEDEPLGRRALADLPGLGLAIALFTACIAGIVTMRALGLRAATGLGWPTAVAAAGMVLVWRNAAGEDREALRRVGGYLALIDTGGRHRKATLARVVLGVVLAAAGVGAVFGISHHGGVTTGAVLGAGGVVAGFVIVFGPWWLRLAHDLAAERRQRVRSEERADLAAHLHDSVLQTLALIQRSAANPKEVTRLARVQERELRAWLFDERAPGDPARVDATTVAAAIDLLERDVELRHGIAVEAVVVGDAALDDDLRALVAAAREATVNAAKWSGAEVVSVFAEVEPNRASIFVRDRGRGFDLAGVGDDRRGIHESIQGRIERRNGKAVIRTALGEGTEVELIMLRRPA